MHYTSIKSEKGCAQLKLSEKTLKEDYIYKGKILNVRVDEVELPNGAKSKREIIEHSGGVVILALHANGNVSFVNQFRYPYKKVVLELPAGKVEKGEDPLETGKRELKEEVGLTAKRYINLGEYYPTTGYCEEIIYMYLALGLTNGEQDLDENEFLSIETMPIDKAVDMVLKGEIRDGKTQTALLKVAMMLKNGDISLSE